MPSRKQVAEILGIGERQLQRYLKTASALDLFTGFVDKETGMLTGMPIENNEQIEALQAIRTLNLRYKNTKNRTVFIAEELKKINKGANNGQG